MTPLQHVQKAARRGELDRAILLCDFYLSQPLLDDRQALRELRQDLCLRRLRANLQTVTAPC